ncbi:MAG: hypothetical protein R2697_08105 [Ilumatobacteraceae bacterium]
MIDDALRPPLFGLSQPEREKRLAPILRELTEFHIARCPEYARIVDAFFPDPGSTEGLASVPWVPVGLFKRHTIKSVPDDQVFKRITSSGTTGQTPSQVVVDRTTAKRQTRALTSIMTDVLGPGRRPMLVIDTEAILAGRTGRTARAAGVVGLMTLGRDHSFALDASMRPDIARVTDFATEHTGRPTLIFGFTFMVWKYLVQEFGTTGIDLSGATLVHSGGWKQMESEKVDNETFKRELRDRFGIDHVVNFYGMAEQVGSVFVEGDEGLLHASAFADVIVRDPLTWEPLPVGQEGVVQVLSCVPTSYPGHSILTEDTGVIESIDTPGDPFGGKAFRITGRLPQAELRGCSDTFAAGIG